MYLNSEFLELLEELDSAIEETDDKVFLNSLVDKLSEYDYAFIDKNGEELSEKDAMQAVVQSPEQLEQLGKGVCTDFVEFTCAKLDDRQISYEVYYIQCIDEDGDKPAHVFVVVEDNSKFFWVEASWKSEAGVHEYDSLESLFEDIAKKHSIYDNHNYLDSCDIRKIKKSLVGMSQKQIYQYTNSLPITWKAAEEGITESLQQIDYLPVSDVELFKEYADDILDGYGNMSDADIKSTIKEIKFEGRLAGYIGFSEYEDNGHKCLGIGNFMIIERGKGLGSAVIQNIVEKYKNQYDLIYCFVDAKNDGAIRLYKKLGKVYDEDGPNDNGEYYVTFWDNGKWDLDEEFDPPYNEQQVRNNYGEETYQRLIKDPAHLWRMKTGIELIHKEPSKMELERIWANWQLMSEKQKLISDKKSIQLFGKTNAENYSELIKLYDDELNEGKKNNSSKSMAVQQTNTEDKRRLEAVQKYCVPISSIIDTIPDKVGAYEIVASNNFIEDFSKYCKKHKDVAEKAKEKLTMALANMTNGIPKAQIDILSVSGPKKFWELKVGRFRDKQELRAIYFTEDITGLNRKFFILGSFFIHADKKFTGDEKKSAVGTYQNIINY